MTDLSTSTLPSTIAIKPKSIADFPVQRAASPATAAQARARARYFNTGNAFDQKLDEVPDQSFIDELARALNPATSNGLIACDPSQDLGTAYPATTPLEIKRQVNRFYELGRGNDIAGSTLTFSSTQQEASRNVLTPLTDAINSLPSRGSQRPHRHHTIAVSLVIKGERCHLKVDGRRDGWSQWATTVTPPTAEHSHSIDGDEWAKFLISQDGGIYDHTRAHGFEFVGTSANEKAWLFSDSASTFYRLGVASCA